MKSLDQTKPPADNDKSRQNIFLNNYLKAWRMTKKKKETGKESTLEREHQQGERFECSFLPEGTPQFLFYLGHQRT